MFGILCILPNLIILIENDNWTFRPTLSLGLVTIWGLRLSIYVGFRHRDGEDFRYKEMRYEWNRIGSACYYLTSFFGIYMMQCLIVMVI